MGESTQPNSNRARRTTTRIEKECSISEDKWVFYSVYSSKFNKETIRTLMYEMTLDEFLEHREYVNVMFQQEYDQHEDMEQQRREMK